MPFHLPLRALLPLSAAIALVACGSDGLIPPTVTVPRGAVVLDGFIQPAYTVVPDSGTETRRIPLGAPTEFDAGSFEVRNDTALAASSRGAGDLLFITDLGTGVVRRLQMPPRSNPARARLLVGGGGRALIGVPLRDSATVILASVAPAGDATVERLTDLGSCPVDVFRHGGATWVVDANATCATNYRSTGAMRLIRIPASGARQVITLDGLRGSGAAVSVVGDVAYISAGGDADFSTFPFTLVAGGAIARVDLRTGTLLGTRAMPAGTYGGSARLGLDGNLHVTLFEDLSSFRNRTISLRLPDLTPVGTRVSGAEWLALRDATGGAVACGSAVADENGRLHCLQNRTGSATFLLVFAPDGGLVREVAAGQGGVDLRLRR
jgi:hypothetical protein